MNGEATRGRRDREERISELKEAMLAAKKISPAKLAARIGEIGFACQSVGNAAGARTTAWSSFPWRSEPFREPRAWIGWRLSARLRRGNGTEKAAFTHWSGG